MNKWFRKTVGKDKSIKDNISMKSTTKKSPKKLKRKTSTISLNKSYPYSEKFLKSDRKPTVLTLFRNLKSLTIHSTPMSVKLKLGKVPTVLENFRERACSRLKITPSEKQQRKIYQYVVKVNKREALFENMKHEDIKKKFSLTKSKSSILRNMIEDYKKGKDLSFILRKSNVNLEYLDKKDIDSILSLYKATETKKNPFFRNVHNLKKKMRLTKSKAKALDEMKEDYKDRKFSLSEVPNISKVDTSNIENENFIKILDYNKENKMKKAHVPFVKQSRLKQWKSDIRAKLSSQ